MLTWQPCDSGFECATAQVPLDYHEPGGRLIDIAVIRHPATDPAHRIGSLFFNPGGPGGSGTLALAGLPAAFPVGASEIQTWDRLVAGFDHTCGVSAGDLISHLSTANVARDMDLLRQAVGDPRLNYLGISGNGRIEDGWQSGPGDRDR